MKNHNYVYTLNGIALKEVMEHQKDLGIRISNTLLATLETHQRNLYTVTIRSLLEYCASAQKRETHFTNNI